MIPFTLIFWGQTHIPSGLASILNATTPLFTVLIAHFATRDEKLDRRPSSSASPTGFVGVVVMLGPEVLGDTRRRPVRRNSPASSRRSPMRCRQSGAVASAPRPGRHGRGRPADRRERRAGAARNAGRPAVDGWRCRRPRRSPRSSALAVLSTALAYVIYFRILARAGATNLLLVTFLIPVSAILLGTAGARRAARAASFRRHGDHRGRARRHRRPAGADPRTGNADEACREMTARLSASAPASRRDSRRSRAGSCGRASRPRRISPAAGTAGIWNRRGPRAAPASPTGRYRGR